MSAVANDDINRNSYGLRSEMAPDGSEVICTTWLHRALWEKAGLHHRSIQTPPHEPGRGQLDALTTHSHLRPLKLDCASPFGIARSREC